LPDGGILRQLSRRRWREIAHPQRRVPGVGQVEGAPKVLSGAPMALSGMPLREDGDLQRPDERVEPVYGAGGSGKVGAQLGDSAVRREHRLLQRRDHRHEQVEIVRLCRDLGALGVDPCRSAGEGFLDGAEDRGGLGRVSADLGEQAGGAVRRDGPTSRGHRRRERFWVARLGAGFVSACAPLAQGS
jgi:hypothetical protein